MLPCRLQIKDGCRRRSGSSLDSLPVTLMAAQAPGRPTEPLAVARILAAKYPAQPIMSYIPALSWSGSFGCRR